MRAARKLVLKKVVLGELTSSELESVAGGDATRLSNLMQCPTYAQPGCGEVSAMIRPCPTRELVC